MIPTTKILVVDDESDVVDLVGFLAAKEGYSVLKAANGKDALQIALTEQPDLIVMDVMMPEMDGYSATIELGRKKETSSIPVVILTAKGNTKDMFQLTPNVAAYIEKPFDPKDLRETLQQILSRKTRTSGKPF